MKLSVRAKLHLTICIIAIYSAEPIRADWPVFRGNACQTGVASCQLPSALEIKWTFKAKDVIECSPVIADKTVFIGSLDGTLYALDLASGTEKWEYQGRSFKAAAAARDGAVHVGDFDGTFHCVDAMTGRRRWIFNAGGSIVAPANFADGNVLFGADDHHLYCLGPEGKLVWRLKTKDKLRGGPAIADGHVLIGGCDQLLHVVTLSGREVRTIPVHGHVGASAAADGQRVYVGAMSNKFHAIDWVKGMTQWTFEAKRGGQPFFSSPALSDDLVLAGSRDKRLRAWHRQTGKEAWSFPTDGRVDSSPVIAGPRVYFGSHDGHLYVLDLANGKQLARHALGGSVSGSPAISDDRLVIATFPGEVFCLGKR